MRLDPLVNLSPPHGSDGHAVAELQLAYAHPVQSAGSAVGGVDVSVDDHRARVGPGPGRGGPPADLSGVIRNLKIALGHTNRDHRRRDGDRWERKQDGPVWSGLVAGRWLIR